ncbi:AraC family transcriptional regulator [Dactylosporangium sp. NPDC005555]|uniref:AraC family transcriptional regulator n=1 Tax=Dactylosporangium sp. NPDC005555 TaxID=3154889 RepID=UPI0033AFA6FB
MDDDVNREAVGRVIEAMRENLGEQLTVDRMARMALFSKFHFTRVFQRITGISPGRFMSALRLQRAKQLLISTSLSVTEISHEVGYSSVGTFSTRFSSTVGISPSTYRQLDGFAPDLPDLADAHRPASGTATAKVHGNISAPGAGTVFIGVFPDRIPRGRPARCMTLPGPGRYSLERVPPGSWFLFGHHAAQHPLRHTGQQAWDPIAHQAVPRLGRPGGWGTGDRDPGPPRGERPACVPGPTASLGTYGPIRVRPDMVVQADLILRPMSKFDPPVLLALLDGRSRYRAD